MNAELQQLLTLLERMSPMPPATLVVGAWVVGLYRLRVSGEFRLTATRDIDIATSAPFERRKQIRAWTDGLVSKLAPLGYSVTPAGGTYGAASHFTVLSPKDPDWPTVEFLVQEPGGALRRSRRQFEMGGGLVPQSPGRLHLLFESPWVVRSAEGLEIPVSNPFSFVAQKALIRRRGSHWQRDTASILETVEIFAPQDADVRGLASRVASPSTTTRRQVAQARRVFDSEFLASPHPAIAVGLRALGRATGAASVRALAGDLQRFLDACGSGA